MTRRIEHRTRSTWDAKRVYMVLTDRDYLSARLASLGGKDAELTDYQTIGDQVDYQLKHGVAAAQLPPVVRTLLGGDLTIDRTETWRPASDGGYAATVQLNIPGMPGELSGTMRLVNVNDGGSELLVDGTVKIPIPLIGGKIEESVAEQVGQLLDAEHEFTQDWLATQQA